jgi:nucleotide-binding universal stress UspA family protein
MLNTVAVGTDGSQTAAKALDFTIDLAQRYGSRLVVISSYRAVSEDRLRREQRDVLLAAVGTYAVPQDIQWSINPTQDVDAILAEAEEKAHARGLATTSVAGAGDPADILCRHAEEQGADVLVIGNKGMQRRILGSVPNSVAHRAACSVIVVKTT